MNIFRKKKHPKEIVDTDNENHSQPIVTEIKLDKRFRFMYENFVISSQQELYLLLEEKDGIIDLLCFTSVSIYKYGYPNDEIGHPLQKYGLGFYGFFEVKNSQWIAEIEKMNSSHPKHIKGLSSDRKHYVAKFKDVTLEVVCKSYELKQMTKNELNEIITEQINYIKNDS
ncbi:hypothetical protein ACFSKN_15085 [Mariniflexile gromovii]|uniref:Uncharacterized protein n=1 Tax=Mariniflexile gromovii TaxID=362523 RepID=A0ABS4BZ41_9FLAO|nr:hypothetical protein [Mariniflexile gromovii]MBP0905854.1 hypothetical protein [Mariniflexile gromovii]